MTIAGTTPCAYWGRDEHERSADKHEALTMESVIFAPLTLLTTPVGRGAFGRGFAPGSVVFQDIGMGCFKTSK